MEELRKNIIFRGEMVLLNNVSESLKRKEYPYTSIQRQTIFVNMKGEKNLPLHVSSSVPISKYLFTCSKKHKIVKID